MVSAFELESLAESSTSIGPDDRGSGRGGMKGEGSESASEYKDCDSTTAGMDSVGDAKWDIGYIGP